MIFIYGPPAAGKLTVAKELAKITGYRLFHNHLTIDLADEIFEFGTHEHMRLVRKLREDVFAIATQARIPGLIFTYVYAGKPDAPKVKKYLDIVNRHGGHVAFVQLQCQEKELHRRLKTKSRATYNKLRSSKKLAQMMRRQDVVSSVPFKPNLQMDTTHLRAAAVASKIQKYYKLSNVRKG